MYVALVNGRRLGCQPPDPEQVRARRTRRWRLLILILVAAAMAALALHGYTVAGALGVIGAVVLAARIVARYVLGTPAPGGGRGATVPAPGVV